MVKGTSGGGGGKIASFVLVSLQQEISAAEQGTEEVKEPAIIEQSNSVSVTKQTKDETNINQENQSQLVPSQVETAKSAKKEENKPEKKPPPEIEAKSEPILEEIDMSGE